MISCDFDPQKIIENDSVEKVLALARFLLESFPHVALDCRFLILFVPLLARGRSRRDFDYILAATMVTFREDSANR